MVARSRKVVSGMVTGSPPGRSAHKVLYDRVKAMLDLGVVSVLLMLAGVADHSALLARRPLGLQGLTALLSEAIGFLWADHHDLQDPDDVRGLRAAFRPDVVGPG